ncbi:hypothetical protein XCR1_940020 [Xenorhabdus cabanillasii JM26]|uniref:Uncharacterized protein n=1 Tax=Xenorhabdus cabanillasii JM26 TaxID=1427517 RepID=W1JA10_9GAMM|nr:hypothetical protein XCR1_940020 [Xenorhabdus cabanillasii JM26]
MWSFNISCKLLMNFDGGIYFDYEFNIGRKNVMEKSGRVQLMLVQNNSLILCYW